MTNRTEDHEIEDRLRRTFQAVAATTKVSDDLLAEPADVIRLETQRFRHRSRRPYVLVGATAAAVLVTAGVTAVLASRDAGETTVPPATTSDVVAPDPASFTAEPGRHAVLDTPFVADWLPSLGEQVSDARTAVRVERWSDGSRELVVVHGVGLASWPCEADCVGAENGTVGAYSSTVSEAELAAIAADAGSLEGGPFTLAGTSTIVPDGPSTQASWTHRSGEKTVYISSYVGAEFLDSAEVGTELDVLGRPARFIAGLLNPGRDVLIWSPTDELVVVIGGSGVAQEELIDYASDVVLLSDAEWNDLLDDPRDRDNDGLGEPVPVAVSASGRWQLVTYHSGGLGSGVSTCVGVSVADEVVNGMCLQPGPVEKRGAPFRLLVQPVGDSAVVAGSLVEEPTAASVRIQLSDGQAIEPHNFPTPYGAPIFAIEVPIDLGPVTIEWLDASGVVVDQESHALDQPIVGG